MQRSLLAILVFAVVLISDASALITGGTQEALTTKDLPRGALELANLKSRIAWWEGPPFGGGQYHFDYVGKTNDLQKAIDLFAQLDVTRKHLIVRGDPASSFWLDIADRSVKHPIDWQFVVWIPANWERLESSQAGVLPPGEDGESPKSELIVFVSEPLDWKSIQIPAGLTVIDERVEASGLPADQGAVLKGRVTDITGSTISGAKVIVGQEPATTDAAGNVVVSKIPAGTHPIAVSANPIPEKPATAPQR